MIAAMPRFLVTAGNTRERIDRVRDWGNIFTGNTGYAIARALAEVGDVELLTSNPQHLAGAGVEGRIAAAGFVSHADLRRLLAERMTSGNPYDGIFMTAAVADYAPSGAFAVIQRRPGTQPGEEVWVVRDAQAGKVRSHYDQIAFTGTRTEKLIDLFRTEWAYRGLLVKFKLEVGLTREKLIEVGQSSRKASAADYLVANTLEMVSGTEAGAYLLGEGVEEWVPRPQLPARLRRLVEGRGE